MFGTDFFSYTHYHEVCLSEQSTEDGKFSGVIETAPTVTNFNIVFTHKELEKVRNLDAI